VYSLTAAGSVITVLFFFRPGLVVYRYDAPLFFANADDFKRRALAAADACAPVRWFVLNVEANVEVDFTALEAVDAVRAVQITRGGEWLGLGIAAAGVGHFHPQNLTGEVHHHVELTVRVLHRASI